MKWRLEEEEEEQVYPENCKASNKGSKGLRRSPWTDLSR
jgi:hypothetical protein